MDDLYSNLAVIGVTAVVVAAIFFFTHRAKETNTKALAEMSARHGWQYTPISERLAWGAKLNGKTWELIARSESVGQASDSGSSNIQSETTWTGKWTTPPDFELVIGPRLSNSGSVGIYLPPEYAGLKEFDPGMADLSHEYVFMGDGKADLGFLWVSTIPRQLIVWPVKTRPLIKILPRSLEISINGFRMEKPDDFERLVLLGESLVSVIDR